MRNDDPPRDPYLLGSLRKGLQVIDCFTRQKTWSLAELAAELGQTKPTVFRILHTIEAFGYLQKDPQTGRYSLAMRFHTLGSAAVRHEQLRWQALPPLQDLARETGETVHVGILYDNEAICVQAVDGTRLVRMHAFVGKRTPAHASALGKVLLAHLPDAELDAFASLGLRRFTPNTITTATALRDALHQVRTQGWALDDEEMETRPALPGCADYRPRRPALCLRRRLGAGGADGPGTDRRADTAGQGRGGADFATCWAARRCMVRMGGRPDGLDRTRNE